MDPKFNILIRSSSLADHDKDRPNMLSRCIESIRSQSYQNVRLIVSSDNPDDVENIKSLLTDDDTLLELNREDIKTSVGGAREFYNLYCNILAREVDEGWLMFIDDDDYYVANALPMIHQMLHVKNFDEDTMFFWMMENSVGRTYPAGDEIVIGDVGTPMFCIHSSNFRETQSGDGQGILELKEKIKNHHLMRAVLVKVGEDL